jgi:ADP-ribosyl-[dinitrogen reductase] hydrolase
MIGAFVGDCIGSEYEFFRNKNPDVPLFTPKASFTDDTVCTSAIAQWLISGDADPTDTLLDMGRLHLARGFGGKFLEWLRSEHPTPYGSWGNGSAMRASPIALWAATDAQAMELVARSAAPTHGHPDAVNGAQAMVMAIRWAMQGIGIEEICARAETQFGYAGLCAREPVLERPSHRFDVSCAGTVPLALACCLRAHGYEEAIRLCISMGGDADTLAAIAGPVAEALWGVPSDLFFKAARLSRPEDRAMEPILAIYGHPNVRGRIVGGVDAPLRWA